jgi:hypothetical protein
MNLKRLRKLCNDLRNEGFDIKKRGEYHDIFFKKVILARVPDEQLAEHIAKEHGALNERIAKQIEDLIERMEASVKQQLLKLNFGGENVNEGFRTVPDSGHSARELPEGDADGV